MENRIIVVSGIKGGTGKSTTAILLANYFHDKNIPVIVFDADIQGSVAFERSDDLKNNPGKEPNWDVHWIAAMDDFGKAARSLSKIKGVVIIDCPGNIDDPRLQHLYKAAYMAVIPFRYDRKTVKATYDFARAFGKVSRAMMLFVPNLITPFEFFRQSFRESKSFVEENFQPYGDVTPKIMDRVELRDCNTLSLTSKQRSEVRGAFDMIIHYLNIKED